MSSDNRFMGPLNNCKPVQTNMHIIWVIAASAGGAYQTSFGSCIVRQGFYACRFNKSGPSWCKRLCAGRYYVAADINTLIDCGLNNTNGRTHEQRWPQPIQEKWVVPDRQYSKSREYNTALDSAPVTRIGGRNLWGHLVRREPEYIIKDLVEKKIEGGESWKGIEGIGFREGEKVILNDYYPFIENLDELPFLDVAMLPEGIDYFNPLIKRMPYITMITSRGCPGKCTFCTAPSFYGPKYRCRSVESIIEELKYFKSQGYREIYFRDETFTVNKKRILELCKRMMEERLYLTWLCNARVGMINKEMMDTMKEAGCHLIKFGVESGVQKILDNVNKGIRIKSIKETFIWAKEVGMDTHAHIMLGMPGETLETIRDTINFTKEIEPTTVTFGTPSK